MMVYCPRTQELYRDRTDIDHKIYHNHHSPAVFGSCSVESLTKRQDSESYFNRILITDSNTTSG